jgi:YHS domain-containing protein
MKNLIILLFSFFFVACGTAQENKDAAVFSTKEGAIGGYDPVAYFTQSKPMKGMPTISLDWKGATWHFASEENRQLFSQNPEKYVPAYGGWCAYGWSRGYPAKTKPEAWSIVDGTLYLNYDLKVRQLWNEKQAVLIEAANKNFKVAHPGK